MEHEKIDKYIHIHIPKTAGSFIKNLHQVSSKSKIIYPLDVISIDDEKNKHYNFFSDLIKQHFSISFLKKHLPTSKKLKLFSVVRNPYDRIYSMWKFSRRRGRVGGFSPPYVSENFEDFVYELCDDEYLGCYVIQSQLFYLKGMNDFDVTLIKLEDKIKLKNFLVNNCNLIWSDRKVNESPGLHYTEVYTSQMADVVGKKYESVFEIFGYSKEI